MEYLNFLKNKIVIADSSGFDVELDEVNSYLFEFQAWIVKRLCLMGRGAIFADCGLGKTFMQLEWARLALSKNNLKRCLIIAPLAVASQTVNEGGKLGIEVNHCRSADGVREGINITNYENLHKFESSAFDAVVIDESSILKSYDGKFRQALNHFAENIQFKLACTATPAPNDIKEIINHSEFLGVMSGKEALALFFRTDGNSTHAWELKPHAEISFYRWLASWSVAISKPSDIGFDDDGFLLPELNHIEHCVESDVGPGVHGLFGGEPMTLAGRRKARADTIEARVERVVEIVNGLDDQVIIWCGLNKESEMVTSKIKDAVQVTGSDSITHKEDSISGFASGAIRVLVTKPSIAGFGVNWQGCNQMIFLGLSDSFEEFYQAVRRCWRFGQKNDVTAHIVISDLEGVVLSNIKRKEHNAAIMMRGLIDAVSDYQAVKVKRMVMKYKEGMECACGQCLMATA